jgi:hypothetical protein
MVTAAVSSSTLTASIRTTAGSVEVAPVQPSPGAGRERHQVQAAVTAAEVHAVRAVGGVEGAVVELAARATAAAAALASAAAGVSRRARRHQQREAA